MQRRKLGRPDSLDSIVGVCWPISRQSKRGKLGRRVSDDSVHVYREGENCKAETSIHFHWSKSGWVRPAGVAKVLQMVFVHVHDPERGLLEMLTIPVEAPLQGSSLPMGVPRVERVRHSER